MALAIFVVCGVVPCTAQGPLESQASKESADRKSTPDKLTLMPHSRWLEEHERSSPSGIDLRVTSQASNEESLTKLIDRPTAVTFFYTRCTNARKCCSAIGQLESLNQRLIDSEIDARLLAITFEPHYDTPDRLRDYGESMGVHFSDRMRMLQVNLGKQHELTKALDIPVSYQNGWVSMHGIALILFDRQGRFVRRYHTTMWDNDDVFRDLQRLAEEK